MKKNKIISKLILSMILFNASATIAMADTSSIVTADILNVRKNPEVNSEIIGKIHKGESVTVISSGEWATIEFQGKIAYVSSIYLSNQNYELYNLNGDSTDIYFEDLSKVLFEFKNMVEVKSYNLPKEVSSNSSYTELMKNNSLFEDAFNQLGKPYEYSATGPDNFDCSGFTYYVFKENGIKIPRTSEQQSKSGDLVDIDNMVPGDLVFFDTRNLNNSFDITDSYDDETQFIDILFQDEISSIRLQQIESKKFVPEKVTHVGMYIGDNKFIHASTGGNKVIISELASGYYKSRFVVSKRYL